MKETMEYTLSCIQEANLNMFSSQINYICGTNFTTSTNIRKKSCMKETNLKMFRSNLNVYMKET
jgi:hypothetical protein